MNMNLNMNTDMKVNINMKWNLCVYTVYVCLYVHITYLNLNETTNYLLASSFFARFSTNKKPTASSRRKFSPGAVKVRQVAHAAHRNRNFLNRPGNPWFKPKGVGLTGKKSNPQDKKTLRDPGENRPLEEDEEGVYNHRNEMKGI